MNKSVPFWLIQLGNVRPNVSVTPTTQIDDLIDWYYMGCSEFEWGALDMSMTRILLRFSEYKPIPTDLFSKDGKRVVVFTRDESIPEMIVSFADRPNPIKYFDLKAPSYLENVRKHDTSSTASKWFPSFWFCIDNSTDKWGHNRGDWMAMFEEDVPAFLEVMENEKTAWDNLSDDDRNKYKKNSHYYNDDN